MRILHWDLMIPVIKILSVAGCDEIDDEEKYVSLNVKHRMNSSYLRRSHRKCNRDVFISKGDGDRERGAAEDERDSKWRVME